jgi:hypothetical protein
MKKKERILSSLTFWLLLQFLLPGCSGREKEEEIPEVFCKVGINIDWTGVKELPDRVQAIFYPQDMEGRLSTNNLPAKGGNINIKPGKYKVLIYNCDDGEYEVKVRNIEKLETIEAYSEPYTALGTDKKLMWEPLPLYVVQEDLTIDENDIEKTLEVSPQLITQTCSFEIKVKGLEYVKEVSASVSGMAFSYFLGLKRFSDESCTIFVEMQKGNGVLKGKFHFFGVPGSEARALSSIPQQLTLRIVRRDDSIQEEKIDVTAVIQQIIENGNGGGSGEEPGETPGGSTEPGDDIEIEDKIEVPYVPPPSSGGEGGGGIGGEVDDWGDEEEIVLPMK